MTRRSGALGLILVLALVIGACGDDDTGSETTTTAAATTTVAPSTTQAATTTEAPTTTVATFDLVEAVARYTTAIPEGWMAVGDVTAVKDAISAGAYLIDVREVSEYEAGHIEGAVNIPLRTLTANLDLIPTDRQVFVYCKSGYRAGLATSALRILGYDNVLDFTASWNGWTGAGEPVSMDPVTGETFTAPDIEPELFAAVDEFVSTIPEGWLTAGDVEAVKAAIEAGAVLLDVRTPEEYAEGYLPGAINVTLREIPNLMAHIPTDSQVIVYCKSGYRASLAIPILHVLGFDTAKAFTGSYLAWTAAGEPVETP